MTIVPAVRFAAHDLKDQLRADGKFPLAQVIDHGAQAEAFPHSYSPEAVKLGERVLVAAAEGQLETLEALGVQVRTMRDQEGWFA